jgi:hypothetical protein
MTDEPLPTPPPPAPDERPWQYSLLHLFGLMSVVSVCAAAFYWFPPMGTMVSCVVFLVIATYYRTKAVVRTAAPSLRSRSLPSLVIFGIVTSFVACFASLIAFCVTCAAGGLVGIAMQPRYPAAFIIVACLLGVIPALIVLYRSWPRPPKPI